MREPDHSDLLSKINIPRLLLPSGTEFPQDGKESFTG